MAVHIELRQPFAGLTLRSLLARERVAAGVAIGLVGGVLMAVPLVIYDWVRAGHAALEMPMALTAWLFGLGHFVQNGYHWWPIAIGALLFAAYWCVTGLAFAALADRVFHVRTLLGSLAGGFAWGVGSFLLFWEMLLPIARDGAPLRVTLTTPMHVAPNWVWIVAYVVLGLGSGLMYRIVRARATR